MADKSTSNGTGTWLDAAVGPGGLNAPDGTMSDPAVTMNDGIENIAAIDYTGTWTSAGKTVTGSTSRR